MKGNYLIFFTLNKLKKLMYSIALLLSSALCYGIDVSPEGRDKTLGLDEGGVLSTNEPIFLVLGGHHETKVRFQFSFKYRIFDNEIDEDIGEANDIENEVDSTEKSSLVKTFPFLKNLYLSYTQSSLWEIDSDSYPFEDSSYRPGWFIDHYFNKEASLFPSYVRAGYEHESNGQAGLASRTLGTFFVWPFWERQLAGREFIFAPKFFGYTSKDDENPDIADYRSYLDVLMRYGGEQHWSVSTTYRFSKENYSGTFVEFSQPLRKSRDGRTGGYLYVQLFEGYGESLLAYNEQRDIQLRLGFAIVR